ncbi:MAG: arginyl-tRNA--protein arginylyltransferase [Ferruginibacter sp.]|nr:arginyl-tRNA--protein arginylyltransferase [Ferruginibacter sp.]
MFAQIEYPQNLLPEELDKYLANGWFRMRQTIFTTNFLHFNNLFYSAIWLRVVLNHSIHDKKYISLNKLNKGFRTEIKKSAIEGITPSHETLYQHYRKSISFEISPSLYELLFGNEAYSRFNTYEVNIYHHDTLIAAGFFDLGKKSAAGICCIYHSGYKKYSLGKYLIYLKMDFCIRSQLQYFYPGYMVPGYPAFDYKLEIGKATLQYLQLSSQQWLSYPGLVPFLDPLHQMVEKLGKLQFCLEKNNVYTTLLYYKFFEVNLDPSYYGQELFDFPVFLYCFPNTETSHYRIIIYNVCDTKYYLLQCSSIINIDFQQVIPPIFNSDVLKVERVLFATAIPVEICTHLSGILKHDGSA